MRINPGHVSILEDPELRELFEYIIFYFREPKKNAVVHPRTIIETGTYHGLGTTRIVAEIVSEKLKGDKGRGAGRWKAPTFYTIEVDRGNYLKAKANLAPYGWITVINAPSVDREAALEFMAQDGMLLHPQQFPDLYIDCHDQDALRFYSDEVKGALFSRTGNDTIKSSKGALPRVLNVYGAKYGHPLFILDSAGGMGWFEYQEVLRLMEHYPFFLWVHDINHLKHWRSYQHMKETKNCHIIREKEGHWACGAFNIFTVFQCSRDEVWEFRGQKKTMAEWADQLGMSYKTLHLRRVTYLWSIEQCLTTPVEDRSRSASTVE